MLAFIFFRRAAAPRDLHSFPTRRSSDLLVNIGVGQPMDLIIDQAATLGITPATPMLVSYDAHRRRRRDRKSTRLNSSHRCISYAVFCLKKKNKHRIAKLREKHPLYERPE